MLQRVGWREVLPEAFLLNIRDESGLLTGRGGDRYGFMHLGFQEYLCAREWVRRLIAGRGSPQHAAALGELAGHFGESWWREVLVLALAVDETTLFEDLFERWVQREDFAEHVDLVRECVSEALHVSPKPLAAFLEAKHAVGETRDECQLLAAELLERIDPEQWKRVRVGLRKRASREVRELLRMREQAGALETVPSPRGGIERVRIPAGTFWMGADPAGDGDENFMQPAMPLHRVTISQDFYMGRTVVTNRQYRAFLAEVKDAREPEYLNDSRFGGDGQPVVGVSWDDAMAFCRWAGVALPTEAQWEYACRAQRDAERRNRTRYSCGGEAELASAAWFGEGEKGATHPVRLKSPNAFGLYDMHGDVWEWCADWMGKYANSEQTDPVGPPETKAEGREWKGESKPVTWTRGAARVIRGGSFWGGPQGLRSAYRDRGHPDNRGFGLGFRVVLPSPRTPGLVLCRACPEVSGSSGLGHNNPRSRPRPGGGAIAPPDAAPPFG